MNKMSTNGWNTKRLIEGFWTFEKGKENEYTYRVFYFRGMNKKAINDKIKEINQIMDKQNDMLHYAYPSADECEKIITDKSIRLWERKINDFDFMKVKLGNGNIPLKIHIKSENKSFQMEDDELLDIYYDITNQARILKDAPVSFSMTQNNIFAIICKEKGKRCLYMKNIIMQLIAMQSYTNLKLVFLLSDNTSAEFQFAKMLPHVWNNRHDMRFFADNEKDIKEIIICNSGCGTDVCLYRRGKSGIRTYWWTQHFR